MDQENVVYLYNGILFNLKKEENSVIFDNMGELRGHYTKGINPEREKQISHGIHLYVKSIKNKKLN